MASIDIDPVCPRRIQPAWRTRNGMLVSYEQQSAVARLVNTIAYHRTKEYARFGGDVTAPVPDKFYRFAGCCGPLARTMVARILMAPATQVSATSNPRARLIVYDTDGNAVGSGEAAYGYSYGNTPAEVPDEWAVMTICVDVRAHAGECFRAELYAVDEARIISATIYEHALPPDTDQGYVNQVYSASQPILDTDRGDIIELAHALYKKNGPSLLIFSSETDATAPENPNVWRNVIDGIPADARESVSPAGCIVDLRYCARKTKTTVSVKVEVCAKMVSLAFGNGGVRLADAEGNVYAQFVIDSTEPTWYSTTANLPADQRLYCVEHVGNGFNKVITYAASCYRWMA